MQHRERETYGAIIFMDIDCLDFVQIVKDLRGVVTEVKAMKRQKSTGGRKTWRKKKEANKLLDYLISYFITS